MSKKYKTKTRTKKIVAAIVAGVLAIAALAGIIALFRPNTKDEKIKINPAFSVGALDESGAYEKSESTLYTKDAFAAEGLETKVDFDATISYQLFYYDENVEFLSASGTLNVNHVAELPEGTEYARVMIMPDWTGVEVEDQEIGALDKSKYTSQIEFWVNNPDYVEVEEETEDKLTELVIDTEHFGAFPSKETFGEYASTYTDSTNNNTFGEDSSLFAAKDAICYKPMQLDAGKYELCFADCAYIESIKSSSQYAGVAVMYDEDGEFVSAFDNQYFEGIELSDGLYTATWLQIEVSEDVANVVFAIPSHIAPYASIRPVK